jgi:phosphatidate cytidylyltransferase
MLIPRILTAVALLAVLLPALFAATPGPFVLCAWVLLAAAAWEWAKLCGASQWPALVYGAVFAALASWAYTAGYTTGGSPFWKPVWLIASATWVVGGVYMLARGLPAWSGLPRFAQLLLGQLVLLAAFLAVAQARSVGVNFLLSALVLVWVADIGAYFGGKGLSKHFPAKLAPGISPGKTWIGAVSGAACSVLVALAWAWAEQRFGAGGSWGAASLPARLGHGGLLVLGVVFMVALAIVGDLAESLIKRCAGAKDSSKLLPGHGGVLDRIDALLPALPVALMLAAWLERA